MSRTNTAEPIQVPFGVWTRAGPRKHVGVEINSTGRGNFGCFFSGPFKSIGTVYCLVSSNRYYSVINDLYLI